MNHDHQRATKALILSALCLAVLAFSSPTSAYNRWSQNDDATNCRSCHGDFRSSTYTSLSDGQSWGNLHNIHRQTIVSGDCNVCHGDDTFPVLISSSLGGDGMSPLGCVGCHGREEDNVIANPDYPNGYGAGLRQHHFGAGVMVCFDCHQDSDPAIYTPVSEDFLPTYYANPGTSHPNIPTGPCNLDGNEDFAGAAEGLDNDGDGVYDGDDGDCTETSVPGVSSAELYVTNFPNPFNPQTTIRWDLPVAGDVQLTVYNATGNVVRTLVWGERMPEGRHEVTWDGNDDMGHPVPAGVYFYRLNAGVYSAFDRMVMVK